MALILVRPSSQLTASVSTSHRTTASNASVITSHGHYNPTHDQYVPYIPTYEPHSRAAAAPEPDTAQVYDPYKPKTPGVTYALDSTTTTLHDSYDPYRPSTNSTHQPPISSQSSAYGSRNAAGHLSSVAGLVIPPAPADTTKPSLPPFRPKMSNAYDPPLPPPKPRRTTAPTWQATPYTSPPAALRHGRCCQSQQAC